MKTKDFFFELPAENIAQFPSEKRGESRMMFLDRQTGNTEHHVVTELPLLIESGSLVVFNNSRVRKARLFGIDAKNGTQVEFLLMQQLNTPRFASGQWKALVKRAKRQYPGKRFVFSDGTTAEITGQNNGFCELLFDKPIDDAWLDAYGHVPLPPYIKRSDESEDAERYQTVYAKETGSTAAPTAGLHFTESLLSALTAKNIETAFITLHVGLGTFLPVRTEFVQDHKMHTECFFIDDEAANKIEAAKHEGRKILAVGTTTLRTLESAWIGDAAKGTLQRGENATSIFIHGDYHFKTADMLFTNFHTPESTLLMLAASFCGAFAGAEAGRKMILASYETALKTGYQFFSYGDAMLIK